MRAGEGRTGPAAANKGPESPRLASSACPEASGVGRRRVLTPAGKFWLAYIPVALACFGYVFWAIYW